MKQITIVRNNGLHISGINSRDEPIEPDITDTIRELAEALSAELDAIRNPEEQVFDRMKEEIEKYSDDDVVLELINLWPKWETLIGQEGAVGKLLQKDGNLYRIYQALPLIMEHQPPEQLRAHYLWIQHPDEEGQVLPWEDRWAMGKELYKFNDRVTHKGFYWRSKIDGNHHEPSEAAHAAWEKEGPVES